MSSPGRLRFGRASDPPVLQDVTIDFGALTINGQGGVALSAPQLGLLVSGSVTSWDISAPNADGTLWKNINGSAFPQSNLTEVTPYPYTAYTTNAWTPVPSATGAGASGLRTKVGTTYDFTVTAHNAYGSASAHLFVHIVGTAASIGSWRGSNDNTAGSFIGTVAGFQSLGGDTMLVSRGCDRGANGLAFTAYAFTSNVTLKDADATHPATIINITVGGIDFPTNNLTIDLATGGGYNFAVMPSSRYTINSSNNVVLTNPRAFATKDDPPLYGNGTTQINPVDGIVLRGSVTNPCQNLTINDGEFWSHGGCFLDGSTAVGQVTNITVNRLKCRWARNNSFFLGYMSNGTFTDCVSMSNLIFGGLHPDHVQRGDNQAVNNVVFNRFVSMVAGGSIVQGIWHGGSGLNGPEAGFVVKNSLVVENAQNAITYEGSGAGNAVTDVTVYAISTTGPVETNAGSAIQDSTAGTWTANVPVTRTYFLGLKFELTVPGGFVLTNTLFRNNTPVATDFAQADPQTYLSSITPAQWDAMTFAQAVAVHLACFTPSAGHALDLGGGSTIGAINLDGTLKS